MTAEESIEPRSPLSRDRVLRTAIDMADRDGIEAVTMRHLARRLGVEAMSLYHHVENKSALLDGMIDLVVGRSSRKWPSWRRRHPKTIGRPC